MKFALNDEQLALAESAKRFLEKKAGCEAALQVMETQAGFDASVWETMSSELGWTALTIPEAYGGYGLSYTDLIPLLEAMGRYMLCSPFFSSICMGANSILEAGTEEQRTKWLPDLAAGTSRATLAFTEAGGTWCPDDIQTTYTRSEQGFVLNGAKHYVLDGHTAHLLIVAARAEGSTGENGVSLFAVDPNSKGVTISAIKNVDQTRKQANITLEQTQLELSAQLGAGDLAWSVIQRILDLAGVALSLEQVGCAERCLQTAVDYAKIREQFNRPIGSFQAIKHKCADMLVLVESARSAAWYAAWSATQDEGLGDAASQAQSYCSDALYTCAAESIQIHGGIGFTWEHEAHLYFKRAQSSKVLLGTPENHRERIAQALDL
jgi:alkylation response protein AidB-like acyl-CoA dehydrogenase